MLPVEDYLLVHEVIARYGHLVDAKAWDRLDELFTEDLVFIPRQEGIPPTTTLAQLVERWSAPDFPHPVGHHATNVLIESVEPDGVVKLAWKGIAVERDGRTRSLIYYEHLRRTDVGWRIFWRRVVQRPSEVQAIIRVPSDRTA